MISGLIFDFDGLIIDTESSEYQSWVEIYSMHGIELPIQKWTQGIGTYPASFNPVEYLVSMSGKPLNRAEIISDAHRRNLELISQRNTLPGIREMIHTAKNKNLKIAIASSSPAEWVKSNLSRLELLDQFEVICTSSDVHKTKPAPDVYLCAILGLGLEPVQTVAFEDSPNGVLAAKSAGIFCVAIPNNMTKELDFSGADLIIDSINEFNLQKFLY